MNTWPDDKRRAITQAEHERHNATHYPGTRQMCSLCDAPTERCEEDAYWSDDGKPLCCECWHVEHGEQP